MDFGQHNSAGVVIAALGVSRGIFWAFFIEKTMISEWNSYFERKISGLCQNFTADFGNFNLRVRRKNVREKKNWKNDDFSVFSYFEQKRLDSGQSNWAGVVKTTFGVSRGILWQFFIEKRMVFHVFLHFEQNHCLLLPNIYGRVSESSIYVSGGKTWEEKNEKKMIS